MAAEAIKTSVESGNTGWIRDLLTGITNWRDAAIALVEELSEEGIPFSSGEIALALRTLDQEDCRAAGNLSASRFKFHVTQIGTLLRDRHFAQTLPPFSTSYGDTVYPEMVDCHTQGGQLVYVYAEDRAQAQAHPFEVVIPHHTDYLNDDGTHSWSPAGTPAVTPQVAKPQPTKSNGSTPLVIDGSRAQDKLFEAKVTDDGRVRFPRGAFENLCLKAGKSIKGGDDLHYVVNGDLLVFSLDPVDGTTTKTLKTCDGRVRVSVAETHSLTPGDRFRIAITDKSMSVNLANPV